jgi:VWFA-related protein
MTSRVAALTSRVAALSIVILGCLGLGAQQTPPQTPPPQQPIFRTGTNFVRVDAYPMKDGRIVTNLEKSDFQIFEDGKPQEVDAFELIKVEPFTPEGERRDPNNQKDMFEAVADSKNRAFVVYLDQLHVSVAGAHRTRVPLVHMLNRVMSATDLWGVMTPDMRPTDLVFGRKTATAEDMLARYWPWGSRDTIIRNAEEDQLYVCAIDTNTGKDLIVADGAADRQMIDILVERRREDRILTHLETLVAYLGGIREARKSLIVFSEGWKLFAPDISLASRANGPGSVPAVVSGRGRLGLDNGPKSGSLAWCTQEVTRLALLDNRMRMRNLITQANRANVVFYPINPAGMVSFDYPINQPIFLPLNRSGSTPDNPSGSILLQDHNRLRDRAENAIELANNTDGIAINNTNDLEKGLERIANQLSAYYVLGYYSTNTKFDGKYRKIEVKLKVPGVSVTARRGYMAMTEAEMNANRAPVVKTAGPPEGLTAALGTLSTIRPGAELFGYGVQTGPNELTLVAEVATGLAEAGKWMQGGEIQAVVTSSTGQPAGTGQARLDPGNRGALIKVPLAAGSPAGPWHVRLRLRAEPEMLETTAIIKPLAKAILGPPIVYRAAPGARSALRPVADLLFYRTERAHVEWTSAAPLETRQARLLDRMGAVLPLEVTLGEKPGVALVADLNLAPLSPGDYVIELTVGAAGASETTYVAVRVRK